jgi:FkbM family methyltransferase
MNKNANKMNIRQRAATWLCYHRRSWPYRWMGQVSYLLWRAYENRDFDMQTNGEEWLLRRISSLRDISCVFDVGANVGDWLLACRRHIPGATIHAFEIAPPIFSELQQKVSHLNKLFLNPIGLSDKNDEIEIYHPEASGYRTTAYKEHLGAAYALPGAQEMPPAKSLQVPVIRGDDYVKEHGIQAIDMLKIDVEGMEERVLHGLQEMFSSHRIRLVQFEYNTTNIVSKFLLRDAYDFFIKLGYRVGKLYPNHVDFRDYHYRQEDFCGPNMIAARKEDVELLNLLAPSR